MGMDGDPGAGAVPDDPPRTFRETLRALGPGLIVTASIVGSGELIVTTGLGAKAGFILLWLVVLGCLVKVFVQIELGRFAVVAGKTTLDAMDSLPGPRARVSWLVWIWLVMYVCLGFQLAGILGGVAQTLSGGAGGGALDRSTAVGLAVVTAFLLASGRYRPLERFSTIMVCLFTTCTVVAVVLLQWTPYAMKFSDILEGLEFRLPENFVWAFAAFGITGVGASELIYYPYWCQEKGYGRRVGTAGTAGIPETPGTEGDDAARLERARGWVRVLKIDAWTSMAIYTLATAAFYFLGAAVLHAKSLTVKDADLVPTLSHMYRETFGGVGMAVFLVGAFFVLYSTFFVATASNARLLADALGVFRVVRFRSEEGRRTAVRIACVGLPIAYLAIYLGAWLLGDADFSVSLVLVGAVAQAIMLPLLALLALYLRHRLLDRRLRPGRFWTAALWVAFLCMAAVGVYQAWEKLF